MLLLVNFNNIKIVQRHQRYRVEPQGFNISFSIEGLLLIADLS